MRASAALLAALVVCGGCYQADWQHFDTRPEIDVYCVRSWVPYGISCDWQNTRTTEEPTDAPR